MTPRCYTSWRPCRVSISNGNQFTIPLIHFSALVRKRGPSWESVHDPADTLPDGIKSGMRPAKTGPMPDPNFANHIGAQPRRTVTRREFRAR